MFIELIESVLDETNPSRNRNKVEKKKIISSKGKGKKPKAGFEPDRKGAVMKYRKRPRDIKDPSKESPRNKKWADYEEE